MVAPIYTWIFFLLVMLFCFFDLDDKIVNKQIDILNMKIEKQQQQIDILIEIIIVPN